MARCNDKSLTYLNSIGYNVVRLPRKGIQPLDVLGQDGKSLERLGRIDQMWSSKEALPVAGPPQPAANVNGQTSGDLKLSVGLKMLASALGAMGAAIPDLTFAYRSASSVQFTLTNVHSVGVDPFAAGAFLAAGDLHTANPFVSRYFLEEEPDAFLITEVLTSNQVTVVAKNDNGIDVSVDVPAIQQVVGAKVGVQAVNTSATQISYAGDDPVTFGFKIFEIDFDGGKWRVKGVPADADRAFGVTAGQPGVQAATLQPAIIRPGTLVVR